MGKLFFHISIFYTIINYIKMRLLNFIPIVFLLFFNSFVNSQDYYDYHKISSEPTYKPTFAPTIEPSKILY
jgi:hypothetical protein